MHITDKDMVGPSYAYVIEICDTCHLLLQYLSMNSSLNSEIVTVLARAGRAVPGASALLAPYPRSQSQVSGSGVSPAMSEQRSARP